MAEYRKYQFMDIVGILLSAKFPDSKQKDCAKHLTSLFLFYTKFNIFFLTDQYIYFEVGFINISL